MEENTNVCGCNLSILWSVPYKIGYQETLCLPILGSFKDTDAQFSKLLMIDLFFTSK